MREYIGLNEITLALGPFLSNSDGLTPVTDLTLADADEKAIIKYGASAPVSISANSWTAIASMDGHYLIMLTNSQCDTVGALKITVQDDSKCLPFFEDILLVTSDYWAGKYGASPWATGASISALPNSATLNAHVITLPTSAGLNAHILTLPTSAMVAGIDVSTLPTSETLAAHMATIPTSATVNGLFLTRPSSEAMMNIVATLPTSEAIAAISTQVSSLEAVMPTATAVSSAVFNYGIEGTRTFIESIRIADAVLFGVSSGGNTNTIAFFNTAVSSARVVATVNSDGNRTAVTVFGG